MAPTPRGIVLVNDEYDPLFGLEEVAPLEGCASLRFCTERDVSNHDHYDFANASRGRGLGPKLNSIADHVIGVIPSMIQQRDLGDEDRNPSAYATNFTFDSKEHVVSQILEYVENINSRDLLRK